MRNIALLCPPVASNQVRDNELDQYSVVNNSVYNNYLQVSAPQRARAALSMPQPAAAVMTSARPSQHARHKWLEHIGGDPDEVARSGDALALSKFNIRWHLVPSQLPYT